MFTIDDSGVLKWWTPKQLVFPQIFKIGNKLDDNLGSPNSGNQKSACRLKSPSERSQTHRTEASHPAGGRSPSRYCRSCSSNSPGPPGSCPLHPVAAGACCCWRRRPIAAPCWNSLQGCGPGCCRWFPASPAGCCRSCAKNDPLIRRGLNIKQIRMQLDLCILVFMSCSFLFAMTPCFVGIE